MTESEQYSTHREQLENASPSPNRIKELQAALENAFTNHIEVRQVSYILFDELSAEELAHAFVNYPILIKSVLACINVAARAISRDLQINLDTYANKINITKAATLAGYIKPMLPKEIAIPALLELDRFFWTDKELRANKGRWEKRILKMLNKNSSVTFKKRQFSVQQEKFELDAAYSISEENIEIGIDIKRIESPRDIHKRADEIINKANKYKSQFTQGQFFTILYYPFPSQHQNLISRLNNANINGIFFANESDSSIEQALKLLLGKAGKLKQDDN
ncbi:MAG: hypothetical protein QNJ60_17480 [Xenococcaceae cyanobacterium MO_188.B19]|nr:hypothetical protein [Xenococcaceae cyanobacterium MO_188.B19]